MIWEIGEDHTNTLITAVAQGMKRHLDDKPIIVGGNETYKALCYHCYNTLKKELVDRGSTEELVEPNTTDLDTEEV